MRKLLNTLYVTTQGVYLHREGETVVAEREQKVVMRLPIHTLQSLVCFGNILVSPFLLELCAERGVRVAQMKAADNPTKYAEIARSMVVGKVLNARTVLQTPRTITYVEKSLYTGECNDMNGDEPEVVQAILRPAAARRARPRWRPPARCSGR